MDKRIYVFWELPDELGVAIIVATSAEEAKLIVAQDLAIGAEQPEPERLPQPDDFPVDGGRIYFDPYDI